MTLVLYVNLDDLNKKWMFVNMQTIIIWCLSLLSAVGVDVFLDWPRIKNKAANSERFYGKKKILPLYIDFNSRENVGQRSVVYNNMNYGITSWNKLTPLNVCREKTFPKRYRTLLRITDALTIMGCCHSILLSSTHR